MAQDEAHQREKIRSFTDLRVWKEGHKLVQMIYEITQSFPREEAFGLVTQLRRAAVSVTSNIAEGFSKKTRKEKRKFYTTSLCSLTEVQNQLIVSRDVGHIPTEKYPPVAAQTVIVHKMLNGFMRTAPNKQ